MKRKIKRIASLVLAAVMVFAMAMPAMASESDGPIKGTENVSEHTFKAYQIFSGSQVGDPTPDTDSGTPANPLGNITWGGGIQDGLFLTALIADEGGTFGGIFKDCTTAKDVAEAIAKASEGESTTGWEDDGAKARAFAKLAYKYRDGDGIATGAEVTAGYYLVVDTTDVDGENDVANLALLQFTTAGKFEAKSKVGVPTADKNVQDTNDSTGNPADAWGKSADYDIGDKVPFELTGTVASNYADYETYTFIFHDSEDPGLTFNEDSVKVFFDYDNNGTETPIEKESGLWTVTKNATHEVEPDKEITHTFDITFVDLTRDTNIKANSKIIVRYESELNENAVIGNPGNKNKMYLEFSNNPNEEGTGQTPEYTVLVFTFDVNVDKVNKELKPLAGAEFKLTKYNKKTKVWDDEAEKLVKDSDTGTTRFNFEGIDDGVYCLEETKTPDGYNTMNPNPVYIVVTANHTESGLTGLTSEVGTGWTEERGLTGKDEIKGVVSFSTNNKELVTDDTFGSIGQYGWLTTNVVNNEGTTLPETGGIGTTIFYVVGSVLVLGAVILLVTKRRMKSE